MSKREMTEEKTCGICFDSVSSRGKLDCCDHFFCVPCIRKWSQQENTCPHCKQKLGLVHSSVQVDKFGNAVYIQPKRGASKPKTGRKIRVRNRNQRIDDQFIPFGQFLNDTPAQNEPGFELPGFLGIFPMSIHQTLWNSLRARLRAVGSQAFWPGAIQAYRQPPIGPGSAQQPIAIDDDTTSAQPTPSQASPVRRPSSSAHTTSPALDVIDLADSSDDEAPQPRSSAANDSQLRLQAATPSTCRSPDNTAEVDLISPQSLQSQTVQPTSAVSAPLPSSNVTHVHTHLPDYPAATSAPLDMPRAGEQELISAATPVRASRRGSAGRWMTTRRRANDQHSRRVRQRVN